MVDAGRIVNNRTIITEFPKKLSHFAEVSSSYVELFTTSESQSCSADTSLLLRGGNLSNSPTSSRSAASTPQNLSIHMSERAIEPERCYQHFEVNQFLPYWSNALLSVRINVR